MSLKYEQCTALLRTQTFLRSILQGTEPKTKKELREKAYGCLRHFPPLNENGLPRFSNDEFTDKNGKAVRL